MAVSIEKRNWDSSFLRLTSSESIVESPYYLTPNRKGLDLNLSPYPRRPDVAVHERAGLDFATKDGEMSKGIRLIVGANQNNRFTAKMFEKLRRPDLILIDFNGKVTCFGESKTSKGEDFANEARTKIDLLPRFSHRMVDISNLYTASLIASFSQEELRQLIPSVVIFQEPIQTNLVFLTPYPDNEKILKTIGKGQFKSVSHRVVAV